MDFDFGPIMNACIGQCTISVVTVDTGLPKLLGSGTLVKCRTIKGILTCGHVLEVIEGQDEIGLALFPVVENRRQGMKVAVSKIASEAIKWYQGSPPEDGPDLAFIPLPDETMGSLAASGSVFDLDLGKSRADSPGPENSEALEVVAGAIGKWTPSAQVEGSAMVLSVGGLMNVGMVISTEDSKGFDLITFRPKPEKGFQLPDTYGGTSGGGIWRIYVQKQTDGTYLALQSRLSGVAFYETDLPCRDIIGHGPKSVYGNLLDEIYERWPPLRYS